MTNSLIDNVIVKPGGRAYLKSVSNYGSDYIMPGWVEEQVVHHGMRHTCLRSRIYKTGKK
jgi:hypothetical protein